MNTKNILTLFVRVVIYFAISIVIFASLPLISEIQGGESLAEGGFMYVLLLFFGFNPLFILLALILLLLLFIIWGKFPKIKDVLGNVLIGDKGSRMSNLIVFLAIAVVVFTMFSNFQEPQELSDVTNSGVFRDVASEVEPVEEVKYSDDEEGEVADRWPTVTILKPNGGEILRQDEEYVVSWVYEGGQLEGEFLYFGLRTEQEDVCWLDNVKELVSQGSYSFMPNSVKCGGTVKDLRGGGEFKLQIGVIGFGGGRGVVDYSDSFFFIQK